MQLLKTNHILLAAFPWLVALPAVGAAECRPEKAEGGVTVESCAVDGVSYRMVRGETVVQGSASAMMALLNDAEVCPDWQAICVEERATATDRPFETLRQRVSGRGIARRITIDRTRWWRTAEGTVIGNTIGADELTPDFKGTRVLCMRLRWFLSPGEEAGTMNAVQEVISDPQPPLFGAAIVNSRTIASALETFTNLATALPGASYADPPDIETLPLLEEPLPDVGEDFARCQAARQ